MNQVAKKALRITASVVILLLITIIAGVGYTWYMSEYGNEENQAIQPTSKPTGGSMATNRPKLPDDAVIGASVQSVTSPVTPGSNTSITVKTNPEANCTISVIYDKTPAKDSGLAPKKADEFGIAEWTWTVPASTPLGDWPVEVTCANKKNSAVVENDLRVVKSLD